MRLFGIVKEIAINYVLLVSKDGKDRKFAIKEPWDQFVKFIKPFDELFIETNNTTSVLDEKSLLVLDPRYLVSVTETLNAISCPRKVYINHMGANAQYDPILQQKSLKGILLHEVFTHQVVHGSEIEDAIDQTIERKAIDLLLADFDKRTARQYLNTDAILFKRFNVDGQSELDVRHFGYGLAGKLDALTSNNTIIELKSSKIPDTFPYPDHNIQMGIYQKMMEDYIDKTPKGMILYVSDGETSLKEPTNWSHVKTIIGRNYAYLVLSGKYEPPLLRGEKMKECRGCYRKDGCHQLCAGLEQQRDCNQCYFEVTCSKQEWEEVKQDFYTNQTSALVLEEQEVKKQEYFGHRASFSFDQDDQKIIGTKLKEYTDPNGYFVSEFNYQTTDNRFRNGDFVTIFPTETRTTVEVSYQGIIVNISNKSILLSSANSLPNIIEIYPSSTSALLRRNREIIFKSINSDNNLMNLLVDFIDGKIKDTVSKQLSPIETQDIELITPIMEYNKNQTKAIKLAIETPDFLTIQGPAGTGKTSVIIEIINQLVLRGKSVLVSAFTNMAVDNVAHKLENANIEFLRFGSTTDKTVKDYMIDNQVDLFKEFTKNQSGKVILSTSTTIGKNTFDDLFFDYVLIDEASQMTVAHSLMPIYHGEKAILVGDHKQLPPIVISDDAIEFGLNVSLFEQLVTINPRFVMLNEQYRMSDEILELPNKLFYGGKLVSASTEIGSQKLQYSSKLITQHSLQVIALEEINQFYQSQSNYYEMVVILNLVCELLSNENYKADDIGIITPYRAQVALLRLNLPRVKIDTVDRFQGTESRVVIFSTATNIDVPLLADERRVNVALTRAKEKLIIIQTNPSRIRTNTLMRSIYRDAFRRGRLNEIKLGQFKKLENRLFEIRPELDIVKLKPKLLDHIYQINEYMIYYNSIALISVSLEEDEICVICYQKTQIGVQCPGCSYLFHEDQLIAWIKKAGSCPTCRHKMTLVSNYN